MNELTKRDFLKRLGLLSAAGAAGAARSEDFMPTGSSLPPGAIGDPKNVWFGRNVYPLPHTIEDGPSARMADGRVVMPAREIPVFHETDVVVVGGGPAGFAAAVSSARAGAKTALVERAGSLGGLFTNGMVLAMMGTSVRQENGTWTVVTRGVCGEFMERLRSMGPSATTGRVPENRHWQPTVDPEAAKYLMDRMVEESKVEMFFHAWGVDVIQSGDEVKGVVFQSKQGLQAILAKQVVDCTGDGDIFFSAGCDYRQVTHGIGFVARLGNMDRIAAKCPPASPGVAPDGRPKPWPTRGSGGNRQWWWGGRQGPKGDGLSVRALTAAVPTKGENVLAAGRCIGAPDSIETFRLICPCMVSGQAAGVAAALSVRHGLVPRKLPYAPLKEELLRQGAFLG